MNARQKLFVDNFILTGDVVQSATLAGYKSTYATKSAQKYLERPEIKEYMKDNALQAQELMHTSVSSLHGFWEEIMRDEQHPIQHRLKASEMLGKSIGAFDRQVDVNVRMVSFEGEGEILD